MKTINPDRLKTMFQTLPSVRWFVGPTRGNISKYLDNQNLKGIINMYLDSLMSDADDTDCSEDEIQHAHVVIE